MTPHEMREALLRIQSEISGVEKAARKQATTEVGYQEVVHELAEAWEGLERTVDKVDELTIELS